MKITVKLSVKEFMQLRHDFMADCEEFKKTCKTREEYDKRVSEDMEDPYYEGLFHGEIDDSATCEEIDEELENFGKALAEEIEEEEF